MLLLVPLIEFGFQSSHPSTSSRDGLKMLPSLSSFFGCAEMAVGTHLALEAAAFSKCECNTRTASTILMKTQVFS